MTSFQDTALNILPVIQSPKSSQYRLSTFSTLETIKEESKSPSFLSDISLISYSLDLLDKTLENNVSDSCVLNVRSPLVNKLKVDSKMKCQERAKTPDKKLLNVDKENVPPGMLGFPSEDIKRPNSSVISSRSRRSTFNRVCQSVTKDDKENVDPQKPLINVHNLTDVSEENQPNISQKKEPSIDRKKKVSIYKSKVIAPNAHLRKPLLANGNSLRKPEENIGSDKTFVISPYFEVKERKLDKLNKRSTVSKKKRTQNKLPEIATENRPLSTYFTKYDTTNESINDRTYTFNNSPSKSVQKHSSAKPQVRKKSVKNQKSIKPLSDTTTAINKTLLHDQHMKSGKNNEKNVLNDYTINKGSPELERTFKDSNGAFLSTVPFFKNIDINEQKSSSNTSYKSISSGVDTVTSGSSNSQTTFKLKETAKESLSNTGCLSISSECIETEIAVSSPISPKVKHRKTYIASSSNTRHKLRSSVDIVNETTISGNNVDTFLQKKNLRSYTAVKKRTEKNSKATYLKKLNPLDFENKYSRKKCGGKISSIVPEGFDPFSTEITGGLLSNMNFPHEHHLRGYSKFDTKAPNFNKNTKLGGEVFVIQGELGTGAYARVVKAKKENTFVALKLEKPSCTWEYYIAKEIQKRVNPKIAPAFMNISNAYIYRDASILETDWAEYGSLLNVMNVFKAKTGVSLELGVVIHFAIELCDIVENLHKSKIIHADLKPDNIVLRALPWHDEEMPCLQLIDFGRSIDMSLLPSDTQFHVIFKAEDTKCTEMKEEKPWTYQIDLYGLALTLYCLLARDYMIVVKTNGRWTLKTQLARNQKRELWNPIFDTLLNIDPVKDMPFDFSSIKRPLVEAFESASHTPNNRLYIQSLKSFRSRFSSR